MCAAPSFFLGRQPILDRNQKTVAYELLFRTSNQTGVEVLNDQMATASVISHAFSELGIDAVLGNRTGFINFSAELLLSDIVELLPAGRMVIELLETVEITPEVIERCRVLRQAGFTFALDDMVKITPAHEALLPLIEVVKIDILDTPSAAISGLVMQAHRSGVKVLAEKVETREQARECRELGCDFFQGYFFARPVILEGRRSDPSRQVLLNLLQLTLSNADRGAIERTFKQSPELTYKLMRLVNSVSMGLQTRIESLPRALVVLGSRQLQRWIQVLLFAQHSSGNAPSPLLTLAVTRGKMMELLAERECGDAEYRDQAFMAGILSLID
ncbi:MAG: EAL domain-containing protein, partial [Betaproteobacteria bacterium]|nr:EAL domain-containing protein [Betaproteobacteria bacterium]